MEDTQKAKLVEEFKAKLNKTFAWDLLGESGSPAEGRAELLQVLASVHDEAITAAHDAIFSTIDESRANVLKLKINEED